MRTRGGEGVQNPDNFADVIYGRALKGHGGIPEESDIFWQCRREFVESKGKGNKRAVALYPEVHISLQDVA